ncbi:MAG: hypothetical protein E7262_02660 [Lachnospiraceae bacterium]|nr:hypothetical protein [Lachnospiraceae bacterium]
MIRPIMIQKLDKESKKWISLNKKIHANVNKAKDGSQYLSSSSQQSSVVKKFSMKYSKELSDIQFKRASYRIVFDGVIYNIEDYDDYQEEHITIQLLGVSSGVRFN